MKIGLLVSFLGVCIAAFAWALVEPIADLSMPHIPVLSDGDVPMMIVAALGGAWALWGGFQALRLGEGKLGKIVAALFMVLGLLGSAGFFGFVLVGTKMIPPPADVKAGQTMPEFTLPDANGKDFAFNSLKGKRTVLVFTRGFWCPYCVRELREYQRAYDEIKKAGGEIVAISNDTPEQLKAGAEKSDVKFVLLSDPKALVIKIYHLEHKGLNIREPDQTGARPAVFFLNADLTLSSAWQPDDLRYHLTADELLARFKAAK